jgi:formylglycine-generating enzyme
MLTTLNKTNFGSTFKMSTPPLNIQHHTQHPTPNIQHHIASNIKKLFLSIALLVSFTASAQDSTYTNSVGMEFVLIKPGNFVVGRFQPPYPKPSDHTNSSEEREYSAEEYKRAEMMAKRDSRPGFHVEIKKPFYIGKFEVTQEQWRKVMGNNPSVFQGQKISGDGERYPVENISWNDAQLFVKKLNEMDPGKTYRLPTEFEWEYAARAGAGDDISWEEIRLQAQLGTRTTNVVGQKKSNAWGLYDMLGNVWEWVQDFYNEKIFADTIQPKSGKQHVLKGASFVGDVKNATYMTHAAGPGNGWDVGLRIVMEEKK